MHDIVKAVGHCSYNQLVEKIISCKQSDNSELAGEGERLRRISLSSDKNAAFPSDSLLRRAVSLRRVNRPRVAHVKINQDIQVAPHLMTYFNALQCIAPAVSNSPS